MADRICRKYERFKKPDSASRYLAYMMGISNLPWKRYITECFVCGGFHLIQASTPLAAKQKLEKLYATARRCK